MWLMRVILVLLLFILLLQKGSSSTTASEQEHACPPSSCGKISSISYPFRLKDDPIHCGDSRYELYCENNVTTLYLYSGKYLVRSINYNNFTIQVVDPGVIESNCSSLPRYSLSRSNFCNTYNNNENCMDPYHAGSDGENFFEHIVYLNCSHPVTNNPKYVKTTPCINLPSSKDYYIYAIAGHLTAKNFQVGCHVKFVSPTSWNGLQGNQALSYDKIHKALVYGFEISWMHLQCQRHCENSRICLYHANTKKFECDAYACTTLMGFSASTNCGKWAWVVLSTKGFSMSRGYNYIKDLKKNLDVYKIGFRVLDSWNVSASNGNQHMEFIIGDAKGDCVHVVTRYKEFEQWRSLIEEGKTYTLYNCHVFDNDAVFKHVDHPFKVVFGFGTKVQRNDNLTDIPAHEFRFKPFKEIVDGNFKTDVLYEIIGLLHEIVKTTTGGSGKKPCTNIVLKNESGKLIDVTLLEKYSLALMKFLADRKDIGPVVVILTHAQCKLAA